MNPQASPARTSVTVLFCHGSRNADWRIPFEQLADDYRQRSGQQVRLAFLELMTPDLIQVMAEEVEGGVSSVRIVPLFLAHRQRRLRGQGTSVLDPAAGVVALVIATGAVAYSLSHVPA